MSCLYRQPGKSCILTQPDKVFLWYRHIFRFDHMLDCNFLYRGHTIKYFITFLFEKFHHFVRQLWRLLYNDSTCSFNSESILTCRVASLDITNASFFVIQLYNNRIIFSIVLSYLISPLLFIVLLFTAAPFTATWCTQNGQTAHFGACCPRFFCDFRYAALTKNTSRNTTREK